MILFIIYFHCYMLYISSFSLDLITCLFNFYCFISLILYWANLSLSYIFIGSMVALQCISTVQLLFTTRMLLQLIFHNCVMAISWYFNMHLSQIVGTMFFYIVHWTCILLSCGYWTLNIYIYYYYYYYTHHLCLRRYECSTLSPNSYHVKHLSCTKWSVAHITVNDVNFGLLHDHISPLPMMQYPTTDRKLSLKQSRVREPAIVEETSSQIQVCAGMHARVCTGAMWWNRVILWRI